MPVRVFDSRAYSRVRLILARPVAAGSIISERFAVMKELYHVDRFDDRLTEPRNIPAPGRTNIVREGSESSERLYSLIFLQMVPYPKAAYEMSLPSSACMRALLQRRRCSSKLAPSSIAGRLLASERRRSSFPDDVRNLEAGQNGTDWLSKSPALEGSKCMRNSTGSSRIRRGRSRCRLSAKFMRQVGFSGGMIGRKNCFKQCRYCSNQQE